MGLPETPLNPRPGIRLIGLWDGVRANKLGLLLLFLEELAQMASLKKVQDVDLVVVGGLAIGRVPIEGVSRETLSKCPIKVPLVDMLSSFCLLRRIWAFSEADAAAFVSESDADIYPDLADVTIRDHDTVARIQEFWKAHSRIVPLKLDRIAVTWARELLQNGGPFPRIAVHLKNNPRASGESNANMDAWYGFFSRSLAEGVGSFFLIGDDEIDPRILRLANVTLVRLKHAPNIAGNLGIIQECDAFMGMMSGFCNFALLGVKPYLIFKNPLHHKGKMDSEIGIMDRFMFSHPGQRVLREYETPSRLWNEFGRLRSI